MTREACPRCGAERPVLGPCPECGYEDPHPGVLGAFRQAAAQLRAQPLLFFVFLIPVAVLLVTQALLTGIESPEGVTRPGEVAAGLTALFLQAGWYFVVVGAITPRVTGDGEASLVPEGPVYVAAAQGAALVVAPWALLATILLVQPAGSLGALALVASLLLLISTVVALGRAVGLPVEAALTGASGLDVFKRGNERARENGGLGTAFLGVLGLGAAFVVPALALTLTIGRPSSLTMIAIGSATSWLVGSWVGVAIAIGLSGGQTISRSFACPRCGEQAEAEAGRARCTGCGIEGPYYPGEHAV